MRLNLRLTTMPLKNLLRKGKKYDVSSRNAYVVCIHLLNGTLIEFTLTSESTGQECLENIAQRIELNEFVYFGLRYVNKKLQFRWLELEKPLKKQLDKNAHSPLLYFGVMFYVPEADAIEDPMTRYQYYMQLKSEVIDGKLPCTPEQAVLLAAYSVQGEFGDFEEGKHNVDFFKEYVLLPRTMSTDEHLLQKMNQEIVNTHRNLQGVMPQEAEQQYIIEAQHLEGYGLEYFSAKDDSNNDIHLGVSVVGLFVKPLPETGRPTSYFKWTDINKIIPNKKTLGIETSLSAKTVHFQLDDADAARYVHKMCLLQREFCSYLGSRSVQGDHSVHSNSGAAEAVGLLGDNHQISQNQLKADQVETHHLTGESQFRREESEQRDTNSGVALSSSYPEIPLADSQGGHQSALELQMQTDLHSHMQPDSQPNLNQPVLDPALSTMYQYEPLDGAYGQASVNTMDALDTAQQAHIQQYMEAMVQAGVEPQHNGFIPGQVSAAYTAESIQVPQYRAAPDYHSVMRQMAAMQPQHQPPPQQPPPPQQHIGTSDVYSHPETMAYSQPEISRTPPTYQQYLQQNNRNPVQYSRSVLETRPNPQNFAHSGSQYHHYQPTGYGKPVDRTNSLNIHPTYSMPEISWRGLLNQFSTSEIQLTEKLAAQQIAYKPPPPYPRLGSTSTPDLASQAARLAVTSTPDLVSSKELTNLTLRMQPHNDQSADNPALDRLQVSQQAGADSNVPEHGTSSEQLSAQYGIAGPVYSTALQVQGQDMLNQHYSSNGNIGQQYMGSGNIGPQPYGQQQFTGSENIPQPFIENHRLSRQFAGSGNVGPQQFAGSGNVGPQAFTGSGNVGPSQFAGSGNIGPQQFAGSGNVGPQYTGSGNVGPQYSGSGNVGPQYIQYANPTSVDQSFAAQYAISTNMAVQQYENIPPPHYGASMNVSLQHYGGSNNMIQQQFNGPGSSGNIGPQVSNRYSDEYETEDPNKEVFITGPPNQNAPPSYHPLLGQQYSQNLGSKQIFYTANGIDLLNDPRAQESDKIPSVQEHIYQNLPAQKSLSQQRLLEYGDENPYENLPSALEGLHMLEAAHGEAEQQIADPEVLQCLDTTKDVDSIPNHSQSSSLDAPNTNTQASPGNVCASKGQPQTSPGRGNPTNGEHLQVGEENLNREGVKDSNTHDAVFKEVQMRNPPLPVIETPNNHPIASASISLPSSQPYRGNQRVRSISTGSQERNSIVSTGDTTLDVPVPRDRSVSTSSYERLLTTRDETRNNRETNEGQNHSASCQERSGERGQASKEEDRNGLDVLIPRPSVTSSQPSPAAPSQTTFDAFKSEPHAKERSPTSSTSSASQCRPLEESGLNGSLSVSRADMIEHNDNELRAPKDDRRRAFERKLEDDQVYAEFEQIPKKKSKCDCSCATLEQNVLRNRFKDVLPYDVNRVKLTPTKQNPSGYINASHVKTTVAGKESWFIASQGPLENTVQDFWQMIWEQESLVIAMLTDLNEFGKQKCQRYWPEEKGPKKAVKFGEYQVTLKFLNDSGSYVTRGLVLRHKKHKKERLVWHLQYTDWPDHGCPEDTYGFLAYLDEIESVRRHAVLEHSDDRQTPVIVHCSAGVGRSGVVILAEVMKACLEHNESIAIDAVLEKMRQQRMHLVQTVSQYSFVYKTLITYLKSSRLI